MVDDLVNELTALAAKYLIVETYFVGQTVLPAMETLNLSGGNGWHRSAKIEAGIFCQPEEIQF